MAVTTFDLIKRSQVKLKDDCDCQIVILDQNQHGFCAHSLFTSSEQQSSPFSD